MFGARSSTTGTDRRATAPSDVSSWGFADRLGDMISVHAPNGDYLYASAAARQLLGHDPRELSGTNAYDYIHPDDLRDIELAHRSALGGAPVTVVYRFLHSNGSYVWVETTTEIEIDPELGTVMEIFCVTRPVAYRHSGEGLGDNEREACLTRVRNVLDDETIVPVYQPIVDLSAERTVCVEALSRFPGDPEYTPDRWFGDAWRVGLGIPLELLAVRTATTVLPHLPEDTGLSINVSPPTVSSQGFIGCLGDRADRVAIEITEHMRVDDFEDVQAKLSSLRSAGGQVSIDDFGSGYASFYHVLKVNPDWIKLDTALIERVESDPMSQALVSAVVSFSARAGVGVIAEGIQTAAQLEMLRSLGIRYGQGFHLGHPASLEETLATL